MTTRKRTKKTPKRPRARKLDATNARSLYVDIIEVLRTQHEAMITTLTACTNVLDRCAQAFEQMAAREPLYIVGDARLERRPNGINGGSEPPPPLPAELSERELSEVQRSIAPPGARPIVIEGQE